MKLHEEKLSTKEIFHGRMIDLCVDTNRLENGREATREIVRHPGGVCVLPVDTDGNCYLVRQFRAPFGEVLLEVPAGKLDKGGEDPLEAGRRELKEETGATAENYYFLGKMYSSPGFCDEIIHLYLATGLDFGESSPDEDEFLAVEKLPFADLIKRVLAGEVPDGKTQLAALKADALFRKGTVTFTR